MSESCFHLKVLLFIMKPTIIFVLSQEKRKSDFCPHGDNTTHHPNDFTHWRSSICKFGFFNLTLTPKYCDKDQLYSTGTTDLDRRRCRPILLR
jgi:hypothetical protein